MTVILTIINHNPVAIHCQPDQSTILELRKISEEKAVQRSGSNPGPADRESSMLKGGGTLRPHTSHANQLVARKFRTPWLLGSPQKR